MHALAATTLVGREAELVQLDSSLEQLSSGSGGCLAVEGEAGIGKTSLLAELRARADRGGHLVLDGSAAEFERDVPFSVWIDALDAYVATCRLDRRPQWTGELAATLGTVLPALRGEPGATAVGLADERFQAHRAVNALLGMLSDDQALVLVLDDLHWSDDASTELIAALIRRWTPASVLLVLALRPGQAAPRLTAAIADGPVTRLALGPLDEDDAKVLLADVDPPAVKSIHAEAGGNPFFMEQLARAGPARSAESGTLVAGVVPGGVAASLSDELASLSPVARGFLDAASVAGEPFEAGVAAAVAQLDEDTAFAALDDLLAMDLVRATASPRRFIFRHPLVRRAVYESTAAGWRLRAHARAAGQLGTQGAGPAERAHHIERSAGPGDQAAISLLIEAGTATSQSAPAAAARWFEAALRLLPADDLARRVDVRVTLASAQRSLGELEACRDTLLEAIAEVPAHEVARRIDVTARCAAVEHWLGQHDAAHRRLSRAWEELPDQESADAAAVQIELAVDGMYEMDFEQTLANGRGALDLARRFGDPVLVATAASALALGEAASGRSADAREHCDEAAAHIERLTDAELAARLEALYYLGWAENYVERYDAAIAHAQRGIAIARSTGDGRLLVPMMLVQGYPFEMQGRMAEALAMTESAVEIARLAGHPHYLFWSLFELGWAHYFAGRLEAATDACEESLRVGGRLTRGTMPSAGGGPGWALAVCRFESGDPAAMLERVTELGDADLGWAIPVEKCFNWESLALAELALGHQDAARGYADRAVADAAALDLELPAAVAQRTMAAVMLAAGDHAEATRLAEASVTGAMAAGAAVHVAFSRSLLGRVHAAAGRRAEAIAELRQAERELDAFPSIRPRDAVRRDLRRLGARSEPRGPATGATSGLDALTKREREIAGLVTDRMTNREIAGALFLSEKTVESHVRNVFIKLGVSSRTDIARTVERGRDGRAAYDDAARLAELGYRQQLSRSLHAFDNVAMGFAGISPVVGLYAVALVGTAVAGPAWVWVLPVALAGQCLLLCVYAELASEFPIAGGAYQWSRRLIGGSYGWMTGWVAMCAYAAANTTVAYLGAPWVLSLLGIAASPGRIVLTGMILVVVCAVPGLLGVRVLGRAVKAGIAAEAVASVGIGVTLLLAFHDQRWSLLGDTLGAEALSGGSVVAAMLAALAVGGWVFIGFDACTSAAEETKGAARHVPRAIWIALLSVGALVILNAVAAGLAHPDPAAVVAGEDLDPVTTAVVTSFGEWSTRPFAALVVVAFVACGMAAQMVTARTIYSIARDGLLPASRTLASVNRRGAPAAAIIVTTIAGCLGLLLGLQTAAVGSLIAFGTAGIYVAFLLVALAALMARLRGSWVPAGHVRLGRAGTVLNALAVVWLAFESVNIAWPRESLAPPGAPAYQVWAAPILLAVIGAAGAAYLVIARPHRRI